MSLEKQIEELTAAVRALNDNLFEVLKGHRPDPEPAPELEQKPTRRKVKTDAEPRPTPAVEQPGKDEVIKALHALQAAKDSGAVKALLARFGAPTVGKLATLSYGEVIEAAQQEAAQ